MIDTEENSETQAQLEEPSKSNTLFILLLTLILTGKFSIYLKYTPHIVQQPMTIDEFLTKFQEHQNLDEHLNKFSELVRRIFHF
jgi:hypothetical protein